MVGRFAEPGHGDGVAAGLAERGCEDLDDPEAERDRRDFGERFGTGFVIGHPRVIVERRLSASRR